MSATWADIQNANAQIKPMQIERFNKKTGKTEVKEYAEVHQRVKAFRMCYPTGLIETEMVSDENGVCVFRARVGFYSGSGFVLLATGTASESKAASAINATSYHENCETSAVGRALGLAGFGIADSIASAEEAARAQMRQRKKPEERKPDAVPPPVEQKPERKASAKQIQIIEKHYVGRDLVDALSGCGVVKAADLTVAQASALISKLARKENGNG